MSADSGLRKVPVGAGGMKIAIVVSRYNEEIGNALVDGALDELQEMGLAAAAADDGSHRGSVQITWVPGAFELPIAARRVARSSGFDAVICLGAVIRGETAHFEYVASEVARGIMQVGLELDIPVVFGVLTTENVEQAFARAGGNRSNKGREAARSAVEMVQTLRRYSVGVG